MTKESLTWTAFYKYEELKTFYITPQVELYGGFCVNKNDHPKAPENYYPILKVIGEGCQQLDIDTASIKADLMNEINFYLDNYDKLTNVRLQLPGYLDSINNGESIAYLYGRYQIKRKCTQQCREFRFGEKAQELANEYNTVQLMIQQISYTSILFTIMAFIMVFHVNGQLKKKQEEKSLFDYAVEFTLLLIIIMTMFLERYYLTVVFVLALLFALFSEWYINWIRINRKKRIYFKSMYFMILICMLIILVLCWMTCYQITNNFDQRTVHFTTAEKNRCIRNVEWQNVLIQWNSYLDLSGVKYVLYWFIFFFLMFSIFALFFFCYCLSKIKDNQSVGYMALYNNQ